MTEFTALSPYLLLTPPPHTHTLMAEEPKALEAEMTPPELTLLVVAA